MKMSSAIATEWVFNVFCFVVETHETHSRLTKSPTCSELAKPTVFDTKMHSAWFAPWCNLQPEMKMQLQLCCWNKKQGARISVNDFIGHIFFHLQNLTSSMFNKHQNDCSSDKLKCNLLCHFWLSSICWLNTQKHCNNANMQAQSIGCTGQMQTVSFELQLCCGTSLAVGCAVQQLWQQQCIVFLSAGACQTAGCSQGAHVQPWSNCHNLRTWQSCELFVCVAKT